MAATRRISRRSALKAGLALLAIPPTIRACVPGPRPSFAACAHLVGKVNADAFAGHEPGTLLVECYDWTCDDGPTFHLAYRPTPWCLVPHPSGGLARWVDSKGRPLFDEADFTRLHLAVGTVFVRPAGSLAESPVRV